MKLHNHRKAFETMPCPSMTSLNLQLSLPNSLAKLMAHRDRLTPQMLFTITAGTLERAAKSLRMPPFMTEVVAVIRKSISALAYSALSMNYLCRCLDVFLIIRQIEHRTGLLSLISVCYVSVSCAPVRIFTQTVIAHFQEMIRVKGGRITAGM